MTIEWNEQRDAILAEVALEGGRSAEQIRAILAGRKEFAGAVIDPAEVAQRISAIRQSLKPHGLLIPRLASNRYRLDGAALAAKLKAQDRRGEV